MKIAILKSPVFLLFVVACLLTIAGYWGLSISSYDKGGSFPLLLLLSVCLVCLGGITALIALVVALGAILRRWVSHRKHSTP